MDQPALNAVVTFRNEFAPGLMVLQVAPDGWNVANFLPGQYVALGLFGSAPRCEGSVAESPAAAPDKLIRRAYSIASSPLNRDFLEFYFNLVPGGVLTPRLFNLKIGDRIWVSPKITGGFTFERVPEDANVVLIANGTGVAPYVSMLTTHLKHRMQRRVALIHGVRHSQDLGHRSTFMAMQHLLPNFSYLPVISRAQEEPVPWKGATGHVQEVWKSDAIEQAWGFRPGADNTHVFLCGSPEMIESTIAMLGEEKFSEHTAIQAGQIHSEKYWPSKAGKAKGLEPATPAIL
jgi:ferredoxin/flavodoxin---NADP+ reductase